MPAGHAVRSVTKKMDHRDKGSGMKGIGTWEPPPARQRRRCGVLSMKTSEPNKNATNPQHQFEVRFSILPLCSQSLARRMPLSLSLSFTLSTNNHFAVALIVPFL